MQPGSFEIRPTERHQMSKHPRLRAVALVVASPAGEILVLQETVTKAHIGKFAGDWSIPMETCELGQDFPATLEQLHQQELAALASIRMSVARFIGWYRVAPNAWAKLYATTSSTYHLPSATEDNPEVKNHRWVSIQDALRLQLRQGAPEMILDYARGLENVFRRHCEVHTQEFVPA